MESKGTVSQVFNNNPQGSRPRGRPRNRWWNVYKQILRSVNLTTGKKGKKNRVDWERAIKEAKVRIGL
jgi:hypothetical protein